MSTTTVRKIPLPDLPSLLSNRYEEEGDDDEDDDCFAPNQGRNSLIRLTKTQPAKKRTRCCMTDRFGIEPSTFSDPEDITPQHILSRKDRVAVSEKVQKHERVLRCPDTPVRTPLRRSFRSRSRELATAPEFSEFSLDMVEIVETLGEGSFGVVYKARYKGDGQLYALKIMKEGCIPTIPPEGLGEPKPSIVGEHHQRAKSDSSSSSISSPRMSSDFASSFTSSDTSSVVSNADENEGLVKPIPFSIDDDDDDDDDDEVDGLSLPEVDDDDVDDDDIVGGGKGDLQDSPRMPVLHYTSFCPKKRRQICEAENQRAISEHPNIVGIKAFWEEPDGRFCILSELCGSSLSTIISQNVNGLEEKVIAGYARDLLSALAYIHKHDVIHLDIKPANILLSLDSSCLKITDFSQAHSIGSKMKPEEGDGRYMAPELLKDIYSKAADIFSLGLTLYQLCIPGLVIPDQGERWEALRNDRIYFGKWRYSAELQNLIKDMLTSDYRRRPSASDLLTRDYFKNILCDSPEVPFVEDGTSSVSSSTSSCAFD